MKQLKTQFAGVAKALSAAAVLGFAVPDVAWLYFALAQFPIYLMPHLLKPLARRLQHYASG